MNKSASGICSLPTELILRIADHCELEYDKWNDVVFGTTALPQTDVSPDVIALSHTSSYLRACLNKKAMGAAVVHPRGELFHGIIASGSDFQTDYIVENKLFEMARSSVSPDTLSRLDNYGRIRHLRSKHFPIEAYRNSDPPLNEHPLESVPNLFAISFELLSADIPHTVQTLSWDFGTWLASWPRRIGPQLRTLVVDKIDFDVVPLVHLPLVTSFEVTRGYGSTDRFGEFLKQMPNLAELRLRDTHIKDAEDDCCFELDGAVWSRLKLLHVLGCCGYPIEVSPKYVFPLMEELQLSGAPLCAQDVLTFAGIAHMPCLKTLAVQLDIHHGITPVFFEVLAREWPTIERLSIYVVDTLWQCWVSALRKTAVFWFQDWHRSEDLTVWHGALSHFRHLREFRHNNDPQDPERPGVVDLAQVLWDITAGAVACVSIPEDDGNSDYSDCDGDEGTDFPTVIRTPSLSFQNSWTSVIAPEGNLKIGYSFQYDDRDYKHMR